MMSEFPPYPPTKYVIGATGSSSFNKEHPDAAPEGGIKMHGFIKKLVDLSNSSKLANWGSHGLAVAAFAGVGWVFGDPITGVNLGGAIYLWRELETVTMKWAATGKLRILEDNLGDLIGPAVVVAFVHLLA